MQRQPTPSVSQADVLRIVERDYAQSMRAAVLAVLHRYGVESWHRETARVRLAVLKLASGDIDELQSRIEMACQDYRDIISWAEYPAYFRHTSSTFGPGEEESLFAADRAQYDEWLNG